MPLTDRSPIDHPDTAQQPMKVITNSPVHFHHPSINLLMLLYICMVCVCVYLFDRSVPSITKFSACCSSWSMLRSSLGIRYTFCNCIHSVRISLPGHHQVRYPRISNSKNAMLVRHLSFLTNFSRIFLLTEKYRLRWCSWGEFHGLDGPDLSPTFYDGPAPCCVGPFLDHAYD